jgi:hypothetical protein
VAFDDHIRVALDRALADVRAPLERALSVLAQNVAVEATDERARVAQTEIDEVHRSAELRSAELRASATRLSDAVRSLDDAQSLREVLEVLADRGGREVDRIAVLVVTGGRLRGYRWSGFDGTAAVSSVDLSLDHAGLAGAIVQTGTMALRPAADAATSTVRPALPPFAQDAVVRDAAALPIVLGGTVAAVVYADAPASDAGALNRWSTALDLLTRHASRVLEAMTIRLVTGLSRPFAVPHPRADGDHAPPGSV